MTCGKVIIRWVVLSTLISGVSALSCSAENVADSSNGVGNSSTFDPGGNSSATNTNIGTSNTVGAIGNSGSQTTNSATLGPNVCAGANARASRIKPTVLFVVDRSSSTADAYQGSSSRWQAIYDALMDPKAGVISKLQSIIFFGVVIFDGPIAGGVGNIVNNVFCIIPGMPCTTDAGATQDTAGSCPELTIVNPALNNFTAIDQEYKALGPGGTTPTALSLEAAYKLIKGGNQSTLDQGAQGPAFVVLCTDGQPNGCMDTLGVPDQQGPIDQLTAAAKNGIKTYVVGVAADAEAQAYLDKLATYGDTGQPAFSPASKGELVKALTQIVGGAVGCKVKLNGAVVAGQECSGSVQLNSQPLECNAANGWKLASESEIELQGNACQQFMNDPQAIVNASFPCNAFVLK